MAEHIRIAMWSGPRNISTTIMRSFENRPDTVVVDEPFYALYLKRTGANHPYRQETLAERPTTIEGVIASLEVTLPAEILIQFEKHIAFHYPQELDFSWLLDRRNFLLIRDPRLMIASYAKKFSDVNPVIESYTISRKIRDYLLANEHDCPILDSSEILSNPDGYLRALCNVLGIDFTASMLAWPPGRRESDGPWAPHWYEAVENSTGFKSGQSNTPRLSENLQEAVDACMDDYNFLYARRLRLQPTNA